jgi:hypothetical protein
MLLKQRQQCGWKSLWLRYGKSDGFCANISKRVISVDCNAMQARFLDKRHIWSLIEIQCRNNRRGLSEKIEDGSAIGAETAQNHVKNYIKGAIVFFHNYSQPLPQTSSQPHAAPEPY